MSILETLAARGAVLRDHHFVYKSGKHGPHYINVDPLFPDVQLMTRICHQLGHPFIGQTDTVAAAATGGIPLSVLTAQQMGDLFHPYPAVTWADKVGNDFAFERAGFPEHLKGKRVLVVEDLLNTGDSVKKVIAQARSHGAEVVGVSVICNRGTETAESLGVPQLTALASVSFQAFDAASCPLCAENARIVVDIGHGKEYQVTHSELPDRQFITLLS